jgi:hypothetical protein
LDHRLKVAINRIFDFDFDGDWDDGDVRLLANDAEIVACAILGLLNGTTNADAVSKLESVIKDLQPLDAVDIEKLLAKRAVTVGLKWADDLPTTAEALATCSICKGRGMVPVLQCLTGSLEQDSWKMEQCGACGGSRFNVTTEQLLEALPIVTESESDAARKDIQEG